MLAVAGLQAAAPDFQKALASGRFADALQTIDPLVRADSGNPTLWVARGMALRGLGRTQDGLASFERALSISPKMLVALEGAAEAAYELKSRATPGYLDRILKLDPGNQTAHAMSAILAFEAHDCASAISHFEKSRDAIALSQVASAQFGSCLLSSNRPLEAADVFEKLLASNPTDENARYNLGLCRLRAGRNAAAIEALKPLADKPDAKPQALSLIASAYEAENQVEPAIAALRRAIEAAPQLESNYVDLAALCMNHQASSLALEVLDTGLKNNARSARLHTARGAMLAELGRLDEAQADFDAAGRLQPDEPYGAAGLSVLYRESAKVDDALALLRQRLKRDPADYRLNYLLADTLMRKEGGMNDRETDEARSALQRSIRSKPDFAKSHVAMGKLYLKTGDPGDAADEFRRALEFDPNDRIALNQLLLALRKIGNEKEARQIAVRLRSAVEKDRATEIRNNRVILK